MWVNCAVELWGPRTWPAVSQSCNRTVRSSRYMVLLRKSIPMVAWYVLSNVSYINLTRNEISVFALNRVGREAYLVMRLVLPTLWSPKRTIFVRLGGDEEKSAETGVPGVSIAVVLLQPTIFTNFSRQNWAAGSMIAPKFRDHTHRHVTYCAGGKYISQADESTSKYHRSLQFLRDVFTSLSGYLQNKTGLRIKGHLRCLGATLARKFPHAHIWDRDTLVDFWGLCYRTIYLGFSNSGVLSSAI